VSRTIGNIIEPDPGGIPKTGQVIPPAGRAGRFRLFISTMDAVQNVWPSGKMAHHYGTSRTSARSTTTGTANGASTTIRENWPLEPQPFMSMTSPLVKAPAGAPSVVLRH